MSRTITVRGTGKASAAPDLIIISLEISARDKVYNKTMELATSQIDDLRKSITEAGFQKEDLKTGNFNINTDYESKRDRNGNYEQIFKGYVCSHKLSLEFNLDMDKLANVLYHISKCKTSPRFSISFTIKDAEPIKSSVLENAVLNAKEKAELLAKASGIKLGKILNISYSWGEVRISSDTSFDLEETLSVNDLLASPRINIVPDDIDLEDGVTIVWEFE